MGVCRHFQASWASQPMWCSLNVVTGDYSRIFVAQMADVICGHLCKADDRRTIKSANFIAGFYRLIFSAKLEQVLLLNLSPKDRPIKSGDKIGRVTQKSANFLSSDIIGRQNRSILSFVCHRLKIAYVHWDLLTFDLLTFSARRCVISCEINLPTKSEAICCV